MSNSLTTNTLPATSAGAIPQNPLVSSATNQQSLKTKRHKWSCEVLSLSPDDELTPVAVQRAMLLALNNEDFLPLLHQEQAWATLLGKQSAIDLDRRIGLGDACADSLEYEIETAVDSLVEELPKLSVPEQTQQLQELWYTGQYFPRIKQRLKYLQICCQEWQLVQRLQIVEADRTLLNLMFELAILSPMARAKRQRQLYGQWHGDQSTTQQIQNLAKALRSLAPNVMGTAVNYVDHFAIRHTQDYQQRAQQQQHVLDNATKRILNNSDVTKNGKEYYIVAGVVFFVVVVVIAFLADHKDKQRRYSNYQLPKNHPSTNQGIWDHLQDPNGQPFEQGDAMKYLQDANKNKNLMPSSGVPTQPSVPKLNPVLPPRPSIQPNTVPNPRPNFNSPPRPMPGASSQPFRP